MKQQLALAYAVASLAAAIAVIAVVGSMVGWSDPTPPGDPAAVTDQREEVVYVDETGAPLLGPPSGRYGDDDEDDDSEDDDSEDDDSEDDDSEDDDSEDDDD